MGRQEWWQKGCRGLPDQDPFQAIDSLTRPGRTPSGAGLWPSSASPSQAKVGYLSISFGHVHHRKGQVSYMPSVQTLQERLGLT